MYRIPRRPVPVLLKAMTAAERVAGSFADVIQSSRFGASLLTGREDSHKLIDRAYWITRQDI